MVISGQAVVGIILLLIVIIGLLYIFYSRTNAVEKNGYGSLIMLALVALMIPVFWIVEGNNQAEAQVKQFDTAVERGMVLYAQNCTNSCFAIVDNKVVNPTYNGYTMKDFSSFSDDEAHRIISGGIYNPKAPIQPLNKNAVPKSDQFGGGLLSNDVEYIFSLIRSTDSSYLHQHGYHAKDGFEGLPAYLQQNNQTLYNSAVAFGRNGQFGEPKDMTNEKQVTLTIADPGQGVTCQSQSGCFTPINIKVKVGTTITWVNKSKLGHTITAIAGRDTASPKAAPQIFDSANGSSSNLVETGKSFSYTVTQAAYNADSENHQVIYFCRIHPDMVAELTIVP